MTSGISHHLLVTFCCGFWPALSTSFTPCPKPAPETCSGTDFQQVLNHFLIHLLNHGMTTWDVDCKIHVAFSKARCLPHTFKSYFCDIKAHGTTICMCPSYIGSLCVPLALHWAECKFTTLCMFYIFYLCLCIIKVNNYINTTYVHLADELHITTH